MDSGGYVTLTRQSGLMRELLVVAHNLANAGTSGFRREGVIFAEHVRALGPDDPPLSMARAHGRSIDLGMGALNHTGRPLDFAIEGEGFFLVDAPGGDRLTRAGSFTPDSAGMLSTPLGHHLLDEGGAPIFMPPQATEIGLGPDGTLSADGQPIARVALVVPEDVARLVREPGLLFHSLAGHRPAETPRLYQGFLEDSNVDAMTEMARLVEVHRAYELGQQFLDREDDRIRGVIQTLGRR